MAQQGTVKWWNNDGGYGFLAVSDGADVFLQRRALEDPEADLSAGDTVTFTPIMGNLGRIAADARKEAKLEDPQLEL